MAAGRAKGQDRDDEEVTVEDKPAGQRLLDLNIRKPRIMYIQGKYTHKHTPTQLDTRPTFVY